MKGTRIEEEAIVLGTVDTGESDRVVRLLTRGHGRVGAFAAGARKSRRRFAGALEPFTLLRVSMAQRRGELFFLDSCTILDAHAGLRMDLGRIAHAGHAAELCRGLCREQEANEPLFSELLAYLRRLAEGEPDPSALLAFELAALEHAGVAPRLDGCAVCGGVVPGGALFDPGHGGILCGICEPTAFAGAMRAEAAVIDAVAGLQRATPFEQRVEDPRVRAGARQLVRRFTYQVLGHAPRSLEFLAQVGVEG